MKSKPHVYSFLVILSLVSQSFVLVNTDSPPNFVENSSILEELAKNSGARTESYTLYKGVEMTPITFDYDGYGTPSWEIYPNLPSDLSFNSVNGTITGTPDGLFNLTDYTVYANASVTSTPPDSILYYNAGDDDDDDGFWEDIHGNDGYDIAISNLERIEATGNTDLTHAYRFDSSSDSAYIGDDFEDWTGDLTDDSISIEMWFKPSALSDNKILWESGGWDNGNSLVLMDDELTYRLKTSGDNAYVDISITISLDSEFHNAIVVLNKEAQMAYLYYDGELKANASFSGNFDWAGNDNTGIGSEKTNVGGYTNSEQTEYFDGDTTFRGDIAIYRILEAALDSSEVEALYDQFTSYRYQETYNLLIEVVEPDTDGDGYPDSIDDFPFDPSEWLDTDGDGIGNNADTDDDNDGILDVDEMNLEDGDTYDAETGLVCREPDSDDYFLDTDLQEVEGWSSVSSESSHWEDSGYLLGTYDSYGRVVVNAPGEGTIVYGNFSSEWPDRPGTDAIITTFWNIDEYAVQLLLSDGTYTDVVDDLERIDHSMKWNDYINFQGTGISSDTAQFRYHLIDFADFNIPSGLTVVGSKVFVDDGVSGGLGDIGQFVIVDDLSNGGKVCRAASLDIDNDGLLNHRDDDADGDGCSDILEAGFTDANGDGQLDGTGIDEDGKVVGSDGYTTPADLDGDGTADYLQSSFSPCRDLYPSEDSADLAIDEPMVNITFQHKTSLVDILELNQNIMAGHRSSCAILTNGSLACWGNGNFGVLGNGERDNTGEPTITSPIPGNHSVIGVDGSRFVTCALLSNGSVACWGGYNTHGEMGNGTIGGITEPVTEPVLVNSMGPGRHAIEVAVGYSTVCALIDNGSVSCWGNSAYGQIGDNQDSTDRATPTYTVPFGGGKKAVAITSGSDHKCALLADGTVSCWGSNEYGQLGNGTTDNSLVPTQTEPLGGPAVAIFSNMQHTCAILEDGSLVCWGKNDYGQVGTGSNSPDKVLIPTLVNQDIWPSDRTVLGVGTGDDHTCALLDNNSVYCWGRDNAAQLGSGDTSLNYNPSPTQLFGDTLSKIAIDSMGDHSCVLIENGSIYCWGRQSHGQIGDGTPYGGDIFVYSPSLVDTSYSFLTEANSLKKSIVDVNYATCSISPDLPDGLSIAQGTCTISGTPSAKISNINYTVTALINDNIYRTAISLSTYYIDSDGDGYLDNFDAFPDDINEWEDTDGDEIGNNADLDDDNDGLNDTIETSSDPATDPFSPDTDGDGFCDGSIAVNNSAGICDAGPDAFPLDPTEWEDTDGDEIGNNVDPDDDGDGYNDTVEITEGSDPLDIESTPLDTDGDFNPDSTDPDDDNDGYNDTVEFAEGSDTLDSESIPLDTDEDFDPDSTDPDDDGDGYNDTDDDFPIDGTEWLDTDEDGIGNNADPDDDGDGYNDTVEFAEGSDTLDSESIPLDTDGDFDPDTTDLDDDGDGIPDNFDPLPTDPNGDFDGDGILDRDEYNPDVDGNPADADDNGENDMLQALASGSTNNSERSPTELCCWALLLLLLLLFPLGKKRYDNSLVYDPHEINYVIGDNESKIRAVPSLHEYTKKYIKLVNKDGLKDITYGISGNLNELEIDSKTGIVSGHPEKVGKYTYEVVMKHSKGKYIGELIVNITIKDEKVEKPEESESVILSSNPEPENTSSKPKFKGGSGTKMDPFVITPAKGIPAGDEIASKQVITISGLKSGRIVNMSDLEISQNSKRFAIVAEPDEVGRQSALVADDDGQIKFRVNFKDDEPSIDGADYEGLIKLGTASVYLSWAVEVIKEESEKEPLSKEQKKEKELERIKARSEKIDFEVLGEATSSKLSKPVEKDTNEIELEDASEFEKKGTATITDVDGSEIITWKSKKGNVLVGIAGLTRAFVAASIVVAKDDLKIIKGIGPFIEEKLNALGIYMFVQIARMTPDLEEEVNVAIEFFPGRVKRDEWVKQANELAK